MLKVTLFIIAIILDLSAVICDNVYFEGKIAGNQKISECVNGYKSTIMQRNPRMYRTTSQFIRGEGYSAEEHVVETEDGYLLTLHRIPGKPGAPPVLLQHGISCSSFSWVVIGKEKALAFKLADAGYDVWLGNIRGNTYGRCHTKYETSSNKFWDFSWHEIGIYDLPAMITHITNTTSQRVIYIGYSMGTTAFFVMAIERPDVASKVKVMIALAPVAYIDHATSPFRILAPFVPEKFFTRAAGLSMPEIFSQSITLKSFIDYACNLSTLQMRLCIKLFFYPSGLDYSRFNHTLAPDILYHFPAGTSMKIIVHYYQLYNSRRFQHYDYGMENNLKLYGSNIPPEYNVSKITVPIGLFWSDNDILANPMDVRRLYEQLPNPIVNYHVDYFNFQHNDYIYALDAPKYVYDKLFSVIDNYKYENYTAL